MIAVMERLISAEEFCEIVLREYEEGKKIGIFETV